MNSPSSRRHPRPRAGFTLIEIMIAVALIGLLAALAIPAFGKIRRAAQNSRFISDLRTFTQAFETFTMNNGGWPPNAGNGIVPTGMTGEFKDTAWTVTQNSLGGRWNWDYNSSSGLAAIATTNVTATDAQMTEIDAKIDDGDLTTGLFQKTGTRFIYILQQ